MHDYFRHDPTTNNCPPLRALTLRYLIRAVQRLDVQASSLVSGRPPRLLNIVDTDSSYTCSHRFDSLLGVQDCSGDDRKIWSLDDISSTFYHIFSEFLAVYHHPMVSARPFNWSSAQPRAGLVFLQNRVDYRLKDWANTFQHHLLTPPATTLEQLTRLVLKVQHTILYILNCTIFAESAKGLDSHLESFQDIIRMSEQVILLRKQLQHTTASCELGIAFPLHKTAMYCSDSAVRSRAADMLAQCGLEGSWNGVIMAQGCAKANEVLLQWQEAHSSGFGKCACDGRIYGDNLDDLYAREKVWTFKLKAERMTDSSAGDWILVKKSVRQDDQSRTG